jgi:hypothetical protein
MRKFFLAFLFIAFNSLVFGQTINDSNVEKRSVNGFHGIEVGTGIKLMLTKGNSEEVAVSASSTEYRDKIVTEVVNGVLKIHYETKLGAINKRDENKELKAYVSYKQLDMLNANTGAEVELQSVLSASSFDLKVTTGAVLKGAINAGSLKVEQSTGSKITMTGTAEKIEIEGSTGSKFEGEELKTTTCNVSVSTGAKVTISAEKDLQVKASTGGIVKYKGNASISEVKTNTGGSVSKI